MPSCTHTSFCSPSVGSRVRVEGFRQQRLVISEEAGCENRFKAFGCLETSESDRKRADEAQRTSAVGREAIEKCYILSVVGERRMQMT